MSLAVVPVAGVPHGPYLLGVDPGFANMGWALLSLAASRPLLVDVGTIRTEKAQKKREVRAGSDELGRATLLGGGLDRILATTGTAPMHLVAVAVEEPSTPRNAAVARKLGMAYGVVTEWTRAASIPLLSVPPQDLKKHAAGRKTASKLDVFRGVETMLIYNDLRGMLRDRGLLDVVDVGTADPPQTSEARWEHAVDAAAVALWAVGHDVVKAAGRARG